MRINKRTYLLIIVLLACTMGMAQSSTPFSISPIASSNGIIALSCSPIIISGTSKCLNVSSGMSTLNVNNYGKGVFGASCVENPPVATVSVSLTSIQLYPNPTHNTSILKCDGQFDANLSCQVRVMSIDGRMMMSQMVPMKDVQAGYTINANNYAAGTYIVTIDFMSQQYSKKLIKL
jgi:hypothetical protein